MWFLLLRGLTCITDHVKITPTKHNPSAIISLSLFNSSFNISLTFVRSFIFSDKILPEDLEPFLGLVLISLFSLFRKLPFLYNSFSMNYSISICLFNIVIDITTHSAICRYLSPQNIFLRRITFAIVKFPSFIIWPRSSDFKIKLFINSFQTQKKWNSSTRHFKSRSAIILWQKSLIRFKLEYL